jgi:hypothetical protein
MNQHMVKVKEFLEGIYTIEGSDQQPIFPTVFSVCRHLIKFRYQDTRLKYTCTIDFTSATIGARLRQPFIHSMGLYHLHGRDFAFVIVVMCSLRDRAVYYPIVNR